MGISEASANNCIDSVMEALDNCRHVYITWPQGARRNKIKCAFGELCFPWAVGSVDGSLIPLNEQP